MFLATALIGALPLLYIGTQHLGEHETIAAFYDEFFFKVAAYATLFSLAAAGIHWGTRAVTRAIAAKAAAVNWSPDKWFKRKPKPVWSKAHPRQATGATTAPPRTKFSPRPSGAGVACAWRPPGVGLPPGGGACRSRLHGPGGRGLPLASAGPGGRGLPLASAAAGVRYTRPEKNCKNFVKNL